MSNPSSQRATFAEGDAAWGTFLERASSDDGAGDDRFIARNFRLDENLSSSRAEAYMNSFPAPGDPKAWLNGHEAYLRRSVAWPGEEPAGRVLDGSDTPETFRDPLLFAAFGDTAPEIQLVRVITDRGLASQAVLKQSIVSAALDAWALGQNDALTAVLRRSRRSAGRLPVFVAPWEDVRDLVPSDETTAPADWANQLRNRLGLSHLAPRRGRSVTILVFRYPVARIPRLRGQPRRRALTVPTVLDARFFAPFCPPPSGSRAGEVVDLSAQLDEPKREALHPLVELKVDDLLRIGSVDAAPPPLPPARSAHLLYLQETTGRSDYGRTTDHDLL